VDGSAGSRSDPRHLVRRERTQLVGVFTTGSHRLFHHEMVTMTVRRQEIERETTGYPRLFVLDRFVTPDVMRLPRATLHCGLLTNGSA
jgi:hypothetical protein